MRDIEKGILSVIKLKQDNHERYLKRLGENWKILGNWNVKKCDNPDSNRQLLQNEQQKAVGNENGEKQATCSSVTSHIVTGFSVEAGPFVLSTILVVFCSVIGQFLGCPSLPPVPVAKFDMIQPSNKLFPATESKSNSYQWRNWHQNDVTLLLVASCPMFLFPKEQ